jgi:hypothetical protein
MSNLQFDLDLETTKAQTSHAQAAEGFRKMSSPSIYEEILSDLERERRSGDIISWIFYFIKEGREKRSTTSMMKVIFEVPEEAQQRSHGSQSHYYEFRIPIGGTE